MFGYPVAWWPLILGQLVFSVEPTSSINWWCPKAPSTMKVPKLGHSCPFTAPVDTMELLGALGVASWMRIAQKELVDPPSPQEGLLVPSPEGAPQWAQIDPARSA